VCVCVCCQAGLGHKRSAATQQSATNNKKRKQTVLDANLEGMYVPQTADTRMAYEALLDMFRRLLKGDNSSNVLKSFADEALDILKNESASNKSMLRDLRALLHGFSDITEEQFAICLNVAKRITDYHAAKMAMDVQKQSYTGEDNANANAVSVEFDEEEVRTIVCVCMHPIL
jgi:hypothetical protein